jgi:hypothetical protein
MSSSQPTPSQILDQMQGLTITNGWDVVNALQADALNQILAQQYVTKTSQGQSLPAINEQVEIGSTFAGTIYAQMVNVVLGAPLISFSPQLEAQQAYLTFPFVSGTVNVLQEDGGLYVVSSSQIILPEDGFIVQGTVPLSQVTGTVTDGTDITLDIANASDFTAQLGLPAGSETPLGQALQAFLKNNMESLSYNLGTIITSPNGTQLVPQSFKFATQFDAAVTDDPGRLLVFIATEFNPDGGTGTSVSSSVPDLVPQGYTTSLVVSSNVLFPGILEPYLASGLSSLNPVVTSQQENSQSAYSLEVATDSLNLGEVQATISTYPPVGSVNYSGYTSGLLGNIAHEESVVVPAQSVAIKSSNNVVSIELDLQWSQSFVSQVTTSNPSTGSHTSYTQFTDNLSSTISGQGTASVDPSTNIITFTSPMPTISLNDDDNWTTDSASDVEKTLEDGVSKAYGPAFDISVVEINAFSVTNLLFGATQTVSLSKAAVPGDLILFGNLATPDLAVTPLQALLTPGQTEQLNVTLDGQGTTAVTWHLSPNLGSVDASNLYTAPAKVSKPTQVVLAATSTADPTQVASALVTLVPAGVYLTPYITLLAAQQMASFLAVVDGAASDTLDWSISPAVGSIDAQGNYTPPSTVTETQAVTVTATDASNSAVTGSATIILLAQSPTGLGVSPNATTVNLGQTQTFQATQGGSPTTDVTWSLYPEVGSIDSTGTYTAPASVEGVQGVMVLATSTTDASVTGSAIVTLIDS